MQRSELYHISDLVFIFLLFYSFEFLTLAVYDFPLISITLGTKKYIALLL